MSDLSIRTLRQAGSFMRTAASAILLIYTLNLVSPGAQAFAREIERQNAVNAQQGADRADFGKALTQVKEHLRVLAGRPDVLNRRPSSDERRKSKDALRGWRDRLHELDRNTQAGFDATGRLIGEKQLSEVLRQRHAAAVEKYHREMSALNAGLDAAINASDEATRQARADSAFKRLDSLPLGHAQRQFDPQHLPNSTLKADPTRHPRTTPKEFLAAGLTDNPRVRLASINPFDISHFPSAADPAYLAPNTEVVLTPAIVSKASELNGNPVAIYNWVRNNVQWQPTWGAVQNSAHTLSSQRGNAFDIATLTIALLRASGIPSRYVHGTIDVPADVFRNWVGGFQNIEAALDYASAGGIPITAIVSGGQITQVRMEHVWVEAAVDFTPSRGAVNRSANHWVALDASYKQVQVVQGIDPVKIAGIDPTQLSNSYLATGTVNQAQNWASGLDPTVVNTAQAQVQSALQNYVQTSPPNATIGDLLGARKIIPVTTPVLPVSLPNTLVAVGARYASLPATLEQQITFAFGVDTDGSPLNPITLPWAQLNNQEVILSFRPATQADEDALAALLPSGTVTDASQWPTSIPGYLIQVIPELKVNGSLVMSGSAMSLGQNLTFVFNPAFVSSGVQPFSYDLPAGSYLAIAVMGGSMSLQSIQGAQTLANQTTAKVSTDLSDLTRDDLLAPGFWNGLLTYYTYYTALAEADGHQAHAYHQLAAGVGSYGYEPRVDSIFGIPRSIDPGNVVMNVPIVNIVGQDSAQYVANKRAYTSLIGFVSSFLEASVPEQLLSLPTEQNVAVSAVTALETALQQGGRVYSLNSTNAPDVLPQTALAADAIAEVYAALNVGKQVLVHTGAVTIPGWQGAGYIILDPETGSGAYKISGNANGSAQKLTDEFALLGAYASGYVSGAIGKYGSQQYWFSDKLKYLSRLAKEFNVLSVVALLASLFQIATDSSLSTFNKFGQISVQLAAYMITNMITEAIAASVVMPLGVALVLTILISVAIAAFVTYLTENYASEYSPPDRARRRFA